MNPRVTPVIGFARLYLRISLDRTGTKTSPERQEQAARAFCQAKGWEVAEVYLDRNISAYTGEPRPEYDRMLADVQPGEVVLVYKLDRLARTVSEAIRVVKLLEEKKAHLAAVQDPIDTSTAMGMAFFQITAVFAELEAGTISERVSNSEAHRASQGKTHGGGYRSYGYAKRTTDGTVVPEGFEDGDVVAGEAEALRQAASRLQEGDSLRAIAGAMNTLGMLTTTGKPWTAGSLAQSLRSPRLRGYREHKGDLYKGDWKPIFEESEHLELVALLADGHRRPTRVGKAHLLTGLAVCGKCGEKLGYAKFTQKNGEVFTRYACKRQPGSSACGGVAVTERTVDDLVVARYIAMVRGYVRNRPEPARKEEIDRLRADISNDKQALEDLVTERYIKRTLPEEHYARARLTLEASIGENEVYLALLLKPSAVTVDWRTEDVESLEEAWRKYDIELHRDLLREAISKVVVKPVAHRGGNKFDPDRIEIIWSE